MSYATMQRSRPCANGPQLRRSAIVSNQHSNAVGGRDSLHKPVLERRRHAEGLDQTPAGPSDSYLKYRCPAGKAVEPQTVTIKPVRIAQDDGKNPTAAPDLSVAKSLFKRCCVKLNVEPVTTFPRTAFQSIDSRGTGVPWQANDEGVDLAVELGADLKATVVTIKDFNVNGVSSIDTDGGAKTLGAGLDTPVSIIVDAAVPEVIAHEVGHALGYGLHDAAAAGTIMEASNSPTKANPPHVNQAVCTGIRSGFVFTDYGLPTCCQEPDK